MPWVWGPAARALRAPPKPRDLLLHPLRNFFWIYSFCPSDVGRLGLTHGVSCFYPLRSHHSHFGEGASFISRAVLGFSFPRLKTIRSLFVLLSAVAACVRSVRLLDLEDTERIFSFLLFLEFLHLLVSLSPSS